MKISKMNRPNIEPWGSSALCFRDVSGLFVFNFPEILILLKFYHMPSKYLEINH